jgi:hypothetical protein
MARQINLFINGKGGAGNLLPVATAAALWLVIGRTASLRSTHPHELISPRSGSPARIGASRILKIR